MFSKISGWIPLAITITALCLLVYVAVQQSYRQGANDPQIQMAEDLRENLNSGQKLAEVTVRVDLNKSLAPFIIVFNEKNQPIYSTTNLEGIPNPPAGIFDFVRSHNQEWFTWEPKPGIRIAAVMIKYNYGFVLTGRSLREIEKREDSLGTMVGIFWLIILGVTFMVTVILRKFIKK